MQAISYKRIWIWIWIGYISKLSFGYRIWIYILFKIEDMDMILYPKKMDMTHSWFLAERLPLYFLSLKTLIPGCPDFPAQHARRAFGAVSKF